MGVNIYEISKYTPITCKQHNFNLYIKNLSKTKTFKLIS